MVHPLLYIIFILPFTAWVGSELKRHYSLKAQWQWLAAAFLVGIIGSQIFRLYPSYVGNFFLHASGGIASTLLFIYLLKTLSINLNWRVSSVILFAFVSSLGVLNELAEYSLELLGFGPFSFDKHDTWRDLTANTVGALTCWLIYKTYLGLSRKNSKGSRG